MAEVEIESKRLSITKLGWTIITIVAICAAVSMCWGVHKYWDDPKLINFLAAWIPTVGSIVIAFVPEGEMTPGKKWLWRISVITIGFLWSVILWHQQVVAESASTKDQERIVSEAVTQSNQHSDQQISSVKNEVGGVKKEVSGVRTDVGGLKQSLAQTTNKLADMLDKSQSKISAGLSKVGKPDPPEPVRLEATFFPTEHDITAPVTRRTIQAANDGTITIDFTFKNIAVTSSASNFDVWLQICRSCHVVIAPQGYDQPKGSDPNVWHRSFQGTLNPGVTFEKQTITIKIDKPFSRGELGFQYACQTCSPDGTKPQKLQIVEGIPSPLGN